MKDSEAKINDIHKVAKAKRFSDFHGILAEFGETAEDKTIAKANMLNTIW